MVAEGEEAVNHDEALTITQMVVTTWPQSKEWGVDEISAYATGLMKYDAATLTRAVAAAQQKLMYRPSVAELREFYDLERAKTRASAELPVEPRARIEKVPLWVRRWVAARYLYARFGKEQDMRRFPEQQDKYSPDMEMMPADAWLEEAEHVTDKQVWATLQT
jgi:hypothetical protein